VASSADARPAQSYRSVSPLVEVLEDTATQADRTAAIAWVAPTRPPPNGLPPDEGRYLCLARERLAKARAT